MHNSCNKYLYVIVGPTGIGKTELSIRIAGRFKTEIISADSRQFYRELKIGTAAPTQVQLNKIKHHCIGNRSITEYYSIFMFEQDVLSILDKLYAKYESVIMTGGSGLYIDAVCLGVDDIPDIDKDIRIKIQKKYEEEGIEGLRFDLKRLDLDFYNTADLKNPKRLMRALEVCVMTGKPFSAFRKDTLVKRPFNIKWIGLNRDREELYKIINMRVDKMIEDGLVEEAKEYYSNRHLNSLNTVGYKELFSFFDGEYSLDRAVELIKRNSRRYAKRQLTWFNKNENIKWFHPDDEQDMIEYLGG